LDPLLAQVIIAAIAALPPTLLAWAAMRSSNRNEAKVEDIHKATNSMKDALVESARANGRASGVKSEQDRSAARAAGIAEGRALGGREKP